MKKSLYIFLILLIFTSCQDDNQQIKFDSESNLRVTSLPFDLLVRTAIDTEEKFDKFQTHFRDSFVLNIANSYLYLGEKQPTVMSIDIRARLVFTEENGKEEKLFIQGNGPVMYKVNVYSGSEQVELLVQQIDSARTARETQ